MYIILISVQFGAQPLPRGPLDPCLIKKIIIVGRGAGFDSMPGLAAHISNHSSSKRGSRDAEIMNLLSQILEETRKIGRSLEELKACVERRSITEVTRGESLRISFLTVV